MSVTVAEHANTEKLVHDALTRAEDGGYLAFLRDNHSYEVALDLCMCEADFETAEPEALVPYVDSWKERRGLNVLNGAAAN
ncbi:MULTISPECIES: hypothetical protein [unclassified Bradyrhizobium]|uniref:hypothetical protein n=1 Tax=unclassified Bradyrhizobium TaxID=2631580 RepID=UPI0033986617